MSILTQSSRLVDGLEKKKHDRRVVLSDDAATVDLCHATRPQHPEEGVFRVDLANIIDFLCFHVAISRGRIDDERITIYSENTLAEWFFAGFAQKKKQKKSNYLMKGSWSSSTLCSGPSTMFSSAIHVIKLNFHSQSPSWRLVPWSGEQRQRVPSIPGRSSKDDLRRNLLVACRVLKLFWHASPVVDGWWSIGSTSTLDLVVALGLLALDLLMTWREPSWYLWWWRLWYHVMIWCGIRDSLLLYLCSARKNLFTYGSLPNT